MAQTNKKNDNDFCIEQEFIAVAFVDDTDQANEYKALLKNNEIPVIIKKVDDEYEDSSRIAVTVPEDYLDEAHVIIQEQHAYNDFYDEVFEENEEDDFDDFSSGFFEDDF